MKKNNNNKKQNKKQTTTTTKQTNKKTKLGESPFCCCINTVFTLGSSTMAVVFMPWLLRENNLTKEMATYWLSDILKSFLSCSASL